MGKSKKPQAKERAEVLVRCSQCGHKIGYASKAYSSICARCEQEEMYGWTEE